MTSGPVICGMMVGAMTKRLYVVSPKPKKSFLTTYVVRARSVSEAIDEVVASLRYYSRSEVVESHECSIIHPERGEVGVLFRNDYDE